MIAVLPFINRILEHCKDTRVFHSQNPRLRDILAFAADIYPLERLKLNLKFDIETMFRNQVTSLGTDAEQLHFCCANCRTNSCTVWHICKSSLAG